MITGTFRLKLENLRQDYIRMARRCFYSYERTKTGGFESRLLLSAAMLHFNAASGMADILKTGRFFAFLNRASRRLPFTLPGMITAVEQRALQKLMWRHARWARTCIRDARGALRSGRWHEYHLFCHASFMNLNVAREIEAVLFPHRAPGPRNDDFLHAFTGGLERP